MPVNLAKTTLLRLTGETKGEQRRAAARLHYKHRTAFFSRGNVESQSASPLSRCELTPKQPRLLQQKQDQDKSAPRLVTEN